MYCENCGNEIEMDSEFCVYCGEKVKKDMETEAVLIAGNTNRKKKYRKGIIAAVITTTMLLAAFIGVWIHNAPARHLMEQLNLGNRYLEEMDYEQAVVAFTKAIEIDPMSVDAYIGAAEAYVGLDDVDEAIIVLEKGYDLTDNEEILRMLEELRERREEKNKETEEVVESVVEENDEDALPYYELGFSPEDFTIAGYSIMDGNHIDDIEQAVAIMLPETYSIPGVEEVGDYIGWSYYRWDEDILRFVYCGSEEYTFADNLYVFYDEGYIRIGVDTDNGRLPVNELPLFEGKVLNNVTSYESALDILGIKQVIQRMEEEGISYFEFESQYGHTLCEKLNDEQMDFNIEMTEEKWRLSIGFYDDIVSFISIGQDFYSN